MPSLWATFGRVSIVLVEVQCLIGHISGSSVGNLWPCDSPPWKSVEFAYVSLVMIMWMYLLFTIIVQTHNKRPNSDCLSVHYENDKRNNLEKLKQTKSNHEDGWKSLVKVLAYLTLSRKSYLFPPVSILLLSSFFLCKSSADSSWFRRQLISVTQILCYQIPADLFNLFYQI